MDKALGSGRKRARHLCLRMLRCATRLLRALGALSAMGALGALQALGDAMEKSAAPAASS